MTDSRNIMSLRGFPPWRVIHTRGDCNDVRANLQISSSSQPPPPDMDARKTGRDEHRRAPTTTIEKRYALGESSKGGAGR